MRGQGLFHGIEFVRDNSDVTNLQPHPDLTKFVVDVLRLHRVIVSRDGPDENIIKVKPPLVFNETHVDQLVSGIEAALNLAIEKQMFI